MTANLVSNSVKSVHSEEEISVQERLQSLQTLTNARVMIVDDEPIMIDVVQIFLEDAGYSHFITTDDSLQAMDLMLNQRPDLLLLDLIMPGKSGFELLAEIRSNPLLRYMPVIVLTAASDAETKLQALELGATDFLSKPVDSSELCLRIRNTLAFKAYLDQLAYSDSLTGLPNRQQFLERLAWTLKLARRHNKQFALIQIGVDRFKQINDSLGHEVGDAVLKAVSKRLSTSLRDSDMLSMLVDREDAINLSRLSGDEFMVLISDIGVSDNTSYIGRRLLEAFKLPFLVDTHELFLSISLGIALFPQDGQQGDELLSNAGVALTTAKQQGGDAYAFYSAETNARLFERLRMETALRKSIDQQALDVHYQPKVDAHTGLIIGCEALVRWNHPELGQVSPAQFVPLAEETGLIMAVGEFVLLRACQDAVQWQQAGHNLPVSVNVSSIQFRRSDIVTIIQAALESSGLMACNLMIELTESLLMENAQANIEMLNRIKQLGVRLSMDDFGTGYSSLSYLKRFPLDELKIDQVFIRELPNDRENAAIVVAVVGMAHGLGLKVTAEGVEAREQLKFLQLHNCDRIQGYFFSRPLPMLEFTIKLQQQPFNFSTANL